MHNICSIFAKLLHNTEGIIFEQYLHNIPTIFVQYLYNIRKIFDPIEMSQFINCTNYGNICIRVKGYDTDIGIGIRDRDEGIGMKG